jgi:predicted DNA-binding protein with PD1-like motif
LLSAAGIAAGQVSYFGHPRPTDEASSVAMALDMDPLPLRLAPGADLRGELEDVLRRRGARAAFVLAGIGSLHRARLRLAGREQLEDLDGDLEILTLAGSLAPAGAHLHMSVADATGRVLGGHVSHGCVVRTTAEVLVVVLPGWSFAREADSATGFPELVIREEPGRAVDAV